MTIEPVRIGNPGREQVGMWLQPPGPAVAAWLLCRPIGLQGTRSASMYRVVAERLARKGCAVLCFDLHGTGDSPGEEDAQTLADWVADTAAAQAWLAAAAPAQVPVSWFAMGLAAHVALRAALRAAPAVRHLLIWEPSLDGGEYLRDLLDAHRAELSREFGHPWPRLIAQGRAHEPSLPGDVLGFDYGNTLASELASLPLLPLAPVLRRGTAVSCAVRASQRPLLSMFEQTPGLALHTIDAPTNWMSSQAMGSAIVPPQVLQLLESCMEQQPA